MRSVALVGPDGAGKSTIAHEVVRSLPTPARYLYMGMNLEATRLMLPTTALARALKRARGRRAQVTAATSAPHVLRPRRGGSSILSDGYSGLRLLAWLGEEWYRAMIALRYSRAGYLVVYDRHFVYDYYASHVVHRTGRSLSTRLHGQLLLRFYPRPDLVVCLDAPAELLHARKSEHSIEALELRRQGYLALRSVAPDLVVVDTTQALPEVVAEITQLIETRLR